jgi:hypothetical protein
MAGRPFEHPATLPYRATPGRVSRCLAWPRPAQPGQGYCNAKKPPPAKAGNIFLARRGSRQPLRLGSGRRFPLRRGNAEIGLLPGVLIGLGELPNIEVLGVAPRVLVVATGWF